MDRVAPRLPKMLSLRNSLPLELRKVVTQDLSCAVGNKVPMKLVPVDLWQERQVGDRLKQRERSKDGHRKKRGGCDVFEWGRPS